MTLVGSKTKPQLCFIRRHCFWAQSHLNSDFFIIPADAMLSWRIISKSKQNVFHSRPSLED